MEDDPNNWNYVAIYQQQLCKPILEILKRRPQWKTISIENDLNGRCPKTLGITGNRQILLCNNCRSALVDSEKIREFLIDGRRPP